MATYKKTFNQLHNMDLLAGFESYSHKIQYLGGF